MSADMTPEPREDSPLRRDELPLEPCCEDQKALRVAAGSVPRRVAGAIAGQIRESGCAELHAVGPEAVNQTVKSIAMAKSYLTEEGVSIYSEIDFMHIEINGEARNGIRFCVKKR